MDTPLGKPKIFRMGSDSQPAQFARRPPKLLEHLRACIRAKHYSIRTEAAYIDWVRRFIVLWEPEAGDRLRRPGGCPVMGIPTAIIGQSRPVEGNYDLTLAARSNLG